MATFNARQKTHRAVLPQRHALESVGADNPGRDETAHGHRRIRRVPGAGHGRGEIAQTGTRPARRHPGMLRHPGSRTVRFIRSCSSWTSTAARSIRAIRPALAACWPPGGPWWSGTLRSSSGCATAWPPTPPCRASRPVSIPAPSTPASQSSALKAEPALACSASSSTIGAARSATSWPLAPPTGGAVGHGTCATARPASPTGPSRRAGSRLLCGTASTRPCRGSTVSPDGPRFGPSTWSGSRSTPTPCPPGNPWRAWNTSRAPCTATRCASISWPRGGGECAYCGTSGVPLNIDHIHPRSRGGSGPDQQSGLVLRSLQPDQERHPGGGFPGRPAENPGQGARSG